MKKSFVILLFCSFFTSLLMAQPINIIGLQKQFSKYKFKQAIKMADKLILEYPDEPAPYFYRGYSTFMYYDGNNNSDIKSVDAFSLALNDLIKAKTLWKVDSAVYIPKEIVRLFQKKMIRYIKKTPKKLMPSEELLKTYTYLFNNSGNSFINFYFEEVFFLVLEKSNGKEQARQYLNQTIEALLDEHLFIDRAVYQDFLSSIYFKLTELHENNIASELLTNMCKTYDNSSDIKRNFFVNSILKYHSDQIWNKTPLTAESQKKIKLSLSRLKAPGKITLLLLK